MRHHKYGAGYKLNEAVRNPTPALKQAAQIGVLVWETPALQDQPDKDAILVAAYGTPDKNAREAAIEPMIDAIGRAHPEAMVLPAFTSRTMIKRVKEAEGLTIPLPEQALEILLREGFTRVAITPLHFFPGMDYCSNAELFNLYRERFKKIVLGTPLMYWMKQEDQRDDVAEFVSALRGELPVLEEGEALLLMGHGTPHPSNSYYAVLQDRIEEAGLQNTHVYTISGWPRLEHILPGLREQGIRRVHLWPLMVAVGGHVRHDMAGDAPDSHKSVLEAAGFEVVPHFRGLGELPAIRALYEERAQEAWDALTE